jgi:catechol 2,3-dioxygenase-like lactoylglutathione lyase family enzyme
MSHSGSGYKTAIWRGVSMLGTNDGSGIPTATNVDHLGVTVPDLQQAIGFFTKVLGAEFLFSFQEGPGTSNPADLNKAFGVPADSKLQIAMLRLGSTLNIELMEYETPDQRTVMPRNSDFDAPHIAFFVSDMDAAADYLVAHGCKLFSGPLVSEGGPKAGRRFATFKRPGACSWRSCRDPSICLMSGIQLHVYSGR